jgi:hypothetical protein
MPESTREALKKLTLAMRKAAGLGDPAAPAGVPDAGQPPGARPDTGRRRAALPITPQ